MKLGTHALGDLRVATSVENWLQQASPGSPITSAHNRAVFEGFRREAVRTALDHGFTIEEIAVMARRPESHVADIAIGPAVD